MMSSAAAIITALTPLLVGVLAATASLAGVHINNKRQDKRALYDSRAESVSKLFASINKSERNLLKIKLLLESREDVTQALQDSLDTVKEISTEYDKSSIFFPTSIAQVIDSILFNISATTAEILIDKKEDSSLENVTKSLEQLRSDKKELREVFQIMMGIKK
ncbi:MAG TPA: hypothetical protein PK265_01505 [Candidatus Saccharibacteria bacterium]|nr:hypothetical protein [Candidatus Saccharibacteria bacterium]HRQ97985.1 hypothetical protein [Candidatus Saccharibacteria bacterium]